MDARLPDIVANEYSFNLSLLKKCCSLFTGICIAHFP